MDRELGRVATLTADLPGGDDTIIALTITDPFGTVLVNAVTVAGIGADRYVYTTVDPLTVAGIYQADWEYLTGRVITQLFTVGRQAIAGISKYMLRIQIASRVSDVMRGEVSSSDISSISDDSIIAGPERYNYWWFLLNPEHDDAGRRFRVTNYNGTALELSRHFITIPDVGESYALFRLDPREIDEAMAIAVNELAQQVRTEVRLEDITIDDDLTTLPRGITHVSEIWADGVKLKPGDWLMRSGRRVGFTTTPAEPVDLIGQREAGFPVWEDSIVETDPFTTVARASMLLHANRAGGAAIDPDEHLRRQLAAADDFERGRRTSVGRILPGSRAVLE
jgi:hypothetical protein